MDTWTFPPTTTAAADQLPVNLTYEDSVPDLYNLSTLDAVQSTCCGGVIAGDELLFFPDSVDGPPTTCSPSPLQLAVPPSLLSGLDGYGESRLTVNYYHQQRWQQQLQLQQEEEEGEMEELTGDAGLGFNEHRCAGFNCQTNSSSNNNNEDATDVAEVPLHVQQLLDIDDFSSSCCDLNQLRTLQWTPTDLLSPVTLEGLPDFSSHIQQQQQHSDSITEQMPLLLQQPSVMSPIEISTTHIILIHLQQPNTAVASGYPIQLPATDLSILNITNSCIVDAANTNNNSCDMDTLSSVVPSLTPRQPSGTTPAFQFHAIDSGDVTAEQLLELSSAETQFPTCMERLVQQEQLTVLERSKSIPVGESTFAAVGKGVVGELAESVISDDILELMQENGFGANWSTPVNVAEQRKTAAIDPSSDSVTSYDPGGKTDEETAAVEEKSIASGRRTSDGRKGTLTRRNRKRKFDDIEDADAVLNEKKERRREQNRRAARGSRQRKREHSITVIKEFQRQQSIQTALKYEMQQLKQAETTLLQALVSHLETCPNSTAAAARSDVTGAA